MKALAVEQPRSARVVEVPAASTRPGEVLVRVRHAGLCGTDLATFLGTNPLVTYPRVIGHEIAGVIEETPAGTPAGWTPGMPVTLSPYRNCGACRACRLGRPNACLRNQTLGVQREGALAELAAVPVNRLYTSTSLSLEQLALAEPFAIGMHAVRRGRVTAGEAVLVIGCGGVGAGAIAAAACRSAHVIGMDLDERKLAQARAFGAAVTIDGREPDARAQLIAATDGEGPAVVIEAAGVPGAYRVALDAVAPCGRIVCLGWVKGEVPVEARHIVAKEMEILGSRNAGGEIAEVLEMFESQAVDPLGLVTHRVPIDEAPAMLAAWAANPAAFGKILVTV